MKIKIYSEYDGWGIEVFDKNTEKYKYRLSWNHNEAEAGVGGEKLIGSLLQNLGYDVEMEDVY